MRAGSNCDCIAIIRSLLKNTIIPVTVKKTCLLTVPSELFATQLYAPSSLSFTGRILSFTPQLLQCQIKNYLLSIQCQHKISLLECRKCNLYQVKLQNATASGFNIFVAAQCLMGSPGKLKGLKFFSQ